MQPLDWDVGIGRTWWAQSSMTEFDLPMKVEIEAETTALRQVLRVSP
jgi:hypothetical protein